MALMTFRCSEGMLDPKQWIYSWAYSWKISLIFMAISFLARRSFQAKTAHQVVDDAEGMLMALGGEVEIEHGGVEAAVPEILLDAADVDTGFQEVGGVAVSKSMNGDALCELKLFKNASQSSLHGGLGHGSCGGWSLSAATAQAGEDPQGITVLLPVIAQCVEGRIG